MRKNEWVVSIGQLATPGGREIIFFQEERSSPSSVHDVILAEDSSISLKSSIEFKWSNP